MLLGMLLERAGDTAEALAQYDLVIQRLDAPASEQGRPDLATLVHPGPYPTPGPCTSSSSSSLSSRVLEGS